MESEMLTPRQLNILDSTQHKAAHVAPVKHRQPPIQSRPSLCSAALTLPASSFPHARLAQKKKPPHLRHNDVIFMWIFQAVSKCLFYSSYRTVLTPDPHRIPHAACPLFVLSRKQDILTEQSRPAHREAASLFWRFRGNCCFTGLLFLFLLWVTGHLSDQHLTGTPALTCQHFHHPADSSACRSGGLKPHEGWRVSSSTFCFYSLMFYLIWMTRKQIFSWTWKMIKN